MSTDIDLFKSNPLVSGGLFDRFMESTSKLTGGGSGGTNRRISIRGGRFRLIVGGEQVSVSKDESMNIIVVDAATVSRTYYEGTYDPEKTSAPTCWSHDSRVPAAEVPDDQRQAARCADCPMNIKGSGQGNSRACRFSQRMAVMLEGELDKIYQLQLPATSIFGQADGKKLPLQAYAKYLAEHKTPIQAVVTTMYFDEDSETPKLYFKPERMVNEAETSALAEHIDSDEVKQATTLTVSQTDKKTEDAPKPKAAAPKVEEPKDDVVEDDEIEEPKKAAKKAKAEPAEKEKLDNLLDQWDD